MSTSESEKILVIAGAQHICGIVLAGAYSWSNSAFDRLVPRALLPVAGWPLISYSLAWLQEGGVRQSVVCTNRDTRSLHSRLSQRFPAGFGDVLYREDRMPRGPAGCARDATSDSNADTFVVVDGTAIPGVDLGDLICRHRVSGAALTVAVHHEATRHGGSGRQVPCGTYVVERRALDFVRDVGYVDIKEHLIPLLYESGQQVLTYPVAQPSPRVFDLTTYLSANEWMVQRLAPSDLDTHDAFVAPDAILIGPVWLGRRACVMAGATIVGPASIGDGSVVKSGALVSRSAVWSHCVIGEAAVTHRCLLADGSVVEPGAHEVGAVKAGRHLPPKDIGATRDSSGLGVLLRRRFAAKPVEDAVVDSGTTATVS